MFEPFQNFLEKASSHWGIRKEIKAAHVCRIFRDLIPEIFVNKETPEKYLDAGSLRENYLIINVNSPAWAQEVIMRKEEIIKKINEKAGQKVINNLRTQLFPYPRE